MMASDVAILLILIESQHFKAILLLKFPREKLVIPLLF